MYEMTLEGLLHAGNSYFARNEADYMLIWVAGATTRSELIINPKENFEEKLAYYRNAYNEDLTLKANPTIKISSFRFVTAEELVEQAAWILD